MIRPDRRAASLLLALGAAGAGAYAFEQVRYRAPSASTWDVTAAWLVGLGCLVGLAVVGGRRSGDGAPAPRPGRRRISAHDIAGLWILALAALARLLALHRFPTVIDADEGTFLTQAFAARHGTFPNPWGTGVLTSVDGYYALEGRVSTLFGGGIASYRVLSAGLGIVTVLAVWRLGRRVLGETAGLVAMAVVAFLPLHLWASRVALDNVSHAAEAALLLWLLDRAVVDRRRADAIGAGLVVGLGAYGYFGGSIFLVVALAVLVGVALLPSYGLGWRGASSIAGWVVLGAVVVAAPLLGHYAANPDRFTGRAQQVEGAAATVGGRARAVLDGALFPVRDRHAPFGDFYRVDGPFLGRVLGPLAVAGVVVWLWWLVRRWRSARPGPPAPAQRCEPLLVAWVVLTAVVSQTEAMSSQRWLALTPIWSLAVASSLLALGRALVARTALRPAWLVAAGAVLVAAVGLASAARFFDEDQQRRAYGDTRTAGAYDLGWRLAHGGAGTDVLSLGAPFQPYSAFGNLRFQVPDGETRITEVEPLVTAGQPGVAAPAVAAGQVAVITPERIATDWCPLARANPQASFAEVRDRYGIVLYLVAWPGRLPLDAGRTPAATTLHPVEVRC